MSTKVMTDRKTARTATKRKTLGTASFDMKLSRHCLGTLIVNDAGKLYDAKGFSEALHNILVEEDVQCVGEATHVFDNDSFTSIFALSESHISIHTWPERYAVQLDVFLCNYIHDNTEKCERLFQAIVNYFEAKEVEQLYVDRL